MGKQTRAHSTQCEEMMRASPVWSSLSHGQALSLPATQEICDETTPPPPSASDSYTNYGRNDVAAKEDYQTAETMPTHGPVGTIVTLSEELPVPPTDGPQIPSHRWGARFIKHPPSPQRPNVWKGSQGQGHLARQPLQLLPKIDDEGMGVISMAQQEDQVKKAGPLEQPPFHYDQTKSHAAMMMMKAPRSYVSGDLKRRRKKKTERTGNESNFRLRSTVFDKQEQNLLQVLRKSDWPKDNRKCLPIFGLFGESERRRLQNKMASSLLQDPTQADADEALTRISSSVGPTSGGDSVWIFTGENGFCPISGNLTSALRRRATRLSCPTNFLDLNLRYGKGLRFNTILEAKGQPLRDTQTSGNKGDTEIDRGGGKDQTPQVEIQGQSHPRKIAIAEGIDFQDLLHPAGDQYHNQPYLPKSLTSHRKRYTALTENASHNHQEKADTGEDRRQSMFPTLVRADLVEQGSFAKDYGYSGLESTSSRVIDVIGSEPGARQRQGFGVDGRVNEETVNIPRVDIAFGLEQDPANSSVQTQRTETSDQSGLNNGYTAEHEEEGVPGDKKKVERAGGMDKLNETELEKRLCDLSGSMLHESLLAKVKQIGLYEHTRKRFYDRENSGHAPRSASSSSSRSCSPSSPRVIKSKRKNEASLRQGETNRAGLSDTMGTSTKKKQIEKNTPAVRKALLRPVEWGRHSQQGGCGRKNNTKTKTRDAYADSLDGWGNPSVDDEQAERWAKNTTIAYKNGAVLPPCKEAIAHAKSLDVFIDEEVQEQLRKYEDTEHGLNPSKLHEPEDNESHFSEDGIDPWQNEREARLFKRIKSKVLRMRKHLPPSDPSKLCFISNVPSCSHQDVKDEIESNGKVKVTYLQYDPVYLEEGNPDAYVSLWIFEISEDSDKINLLLKGFHLKGWPMNVRHLDDVTMEEYRAFQMCDAIRREQRRKWLTKHHKRR